MKKIFSILAISILFLAGCGASYSETNDVKDNPETKKSDEVVSSSSMNFFGEGSLDVYGKTPTVEFTKEGNDITKATFYTMLDGKLVTSPIENATAGTWNEQLEALSKYVVENDMFPSVKDGYADASSGATINVGGFEEAFKKAKEVE